MRWGMLVFAVVAAVGCGGGDDESSSTTTASTAPPTTLISFTDWQTATDAVCAQFEPRINEYIAFSTEPGSVEEAVAQLQGLVAINREYTAALRAIAVPDDRRVDVLQTYHLWSTTDALFDEIITRLAQLDVAGAQLVLARADERFAEAEDLLSDFDLPACSTAD